MIPTEQGIQQSMQMSRKASDYPLDHPLSKAWEKWRTSEEGAQFHGEREIMADLWTAFVAGWEAGRYNNIVTTARHRVKQRDEMEGRKCP